MKDRDYCTRHKQNLPCPFCNTVGGEGDLPLFAHARNSDPATSHEAAASLSDAQLRESQAIVLEALREHGPMPDHELVPLLTGKLSASGARTRRAELAQAGLVAYTGENVRTESGRQAMVWGAV